MTTDRTHKCNFCHGTIQPGDGIGLYWTHGQESEALEPRNLSDAENHLCRRCCRALEAILHRLFKPIA